MAVTYVPAADQQEHHLASIKDVDRKLLWVRSGNECAFPECHQELTIDVGDDPQTQNPVVVGEEAHIVAREDDGPRGDPSMSIPGRNSYGNLILLCPTHHTLIDKEQGKNFSVDDLLEMKRNHERVVASGRRNADLGIDSSAARREALLSGLSESRARLVTRWIAVGVTPEQAEEMADDSSVGVCDEFGEFHAVKNFSVLLGDFGAGKTVALEREYQTAALAAMEEPEAPFPIHLTMKSVGEDLTRVLNERISQMPNSQENVTLFLDGLDEFGAERSAEVADELRSWLYTVQGRKVLATSRLNVNLRDHDCMPLPPLSNEELESLLERVGAHRSLAWGNSPEVSDALHRPLFALIAADCRKAGSKVPHSQGAFLEALVERALNRTSRINVDVHSLLAKLAYLTLNSGSPVTASEVGSREDQRRLVETRLVVTRDRTLSFALPVLEQFFAGQYVLENGLPEIAEFSPRRRDQWRDSLVFAVTAGSWTSVTSLLCDLVKVDPGLSAWVVDKAIPAYEQESSVHLPEPIECGRRLHVALDSWLSGIGPAGGLLKCSDAAGNGVPIAVGTGYQRPNDLTIAFLDPASKPSLERVFEITEGLDWEGGKFDGRRMSVIRSGIVPSNFSAWPWGSCLGWVKNDITEVLKRRDFPLESNNAFLGEYAWHIVRTLTNQKAFTHRPIELDKVISAIDRIFEVTPEFRLVSIQGKVKFSRDELEDLRARCAAGQLPHSRDGKIHRPYPVTDIRPEQGAGHIASCYSDSVLRDLVEQVYANALSIYEDLVALYFRPLLRTLPLGGALPVRFQCKLSRVPEGIARLGDEPMFSRVTLPLSAGSRSQVDVTFVENLYDEPEYATDWHKPPMDRATFRRLRPNSAAWSGPIVSHETLLVFGNRPATALAYKWLWNDLKGIGLAQGNPPYGD